MKARCRSAVALVLVAPAAGSSQYLLSHQQPDGGFAEPGGQLRPEPDRLGGARPRRRRVAPRIARRRSTSTASRPRRRRISRCAILALRRARRGHATPSSGRLESIRRRGWTDRPARQLDDLGRARPARDGSTRRDERPLPPSPAAAERRLVLVIRAARRLERHRGRGPGAAGRGRLGAGAGRSSERSAICASSSDGTAASRSSRAAAPTRSRPRGRSRRSWPPAPRPGRAAFRYLTGLRRPDGSYRYSKPLRDHARLGHVPGRHGPREEAARS